MKIDSFKGLGVALVTPFLKDKSIDYQGFKNLINHLKNDVDYFVLNGTTAESSTLNQNEKEHILDFITKLNTEKKPVVFGIGANNTKNVLDTISKTNFSNINAILSVTPFYNRPSQKGLIAHFLTIADRSPRPIILYNVPGRTAVNLYPKSILTLAQHPNIIGIKQASNNLLEFIEIAKFKPKDFLLISGEDLLTLPMMSIGACGIISVIGNALPQPLKKTVKAAFRNDYQSTQKNVFSIFELTQLIFKENNPAGIKALLHIMGILPSDTLRLPLMPIDKLLKTEMIAALSLYKKNNIF